mgnify:CR=1 FL=1
MGPMLKRHTDSEFEAELNVLRERLVLMAERAATMTERAIEALVQRDSTLARQTRSDDGRVNRDEIELDEMCLLLLAKRQPMASDLRFIAVVLKLVTDVERIADLAANVAERALDLESEAEIPASAAIAHMGDVTVGLLREAIDAFARGDVDKAASIIERDDEVDDLYHDIFLDLLRGMTADPAAVARGIHLQSVVKYLERIGDHVTNMAEQVVFMKRGKDVRHRSLQTETP